MRGGRGRGHPCEALTYAKRAGLDPARVYETIRTGAARSGQLDIIAPKVLNGDFSAAFYLRHFVKDMGIASQECRDRGLELEVLEQVLADCRQIEAEGSQPQRADAPGQFVVLSSGLAGRPQRGGKDGAPAGGPGPGPLHPGVV